MQNNPLSQIIGEQLLMSTVHARSLIQSLTYQMPSTKVIDGSNEELSGKPDASAWISSTVDKDYKVFRFKDGIAHIPISGALLKEIDWRSTYFTGYNQIKREFEAANADPDVKGVLLYINSPGGMVSGLFDLVDFMKDGKTKPVWSIACDLACSAAQAIHSIGDKRFVTQTGVMGSIGAMTMHTSYEGYLKEAGLEITLIHGGEHKVDGNPYKNLPEKVYGKMLDDINSIRQLFAENVAENLSISLDQILEQEAETFRGHEAIEQGLAHEMINVHEIHTEFINHLSETDETNQIGITMSQAQSEGETASTETAAEVKQQERARISAICGSDLAKEQSQLAEYLAYNTDMSAEDAEKLLEASSKTNASSNTETQPGEKFAEVMSKQDNPNLSSDEPATEDAEENEESMADQILNAHAVATGKS